MSTPHYPDLRDTALDTDEKLLERTKLLLDRGLRQQMWLMFLDSEDRQLPLLMPADIPRRPGKREANGFGRFIADLVHDIEATSVALTLERRGNDTINSADAEWFRLARDACAAAEVTLRGPMLCHDGGVRWVAAEDYAL